MIKISTTGQYELIEGTGTLDTSNHPVYQAQVELNLHLGEWIGAPNSGHSLGIRDKQSTEKIGEYNKELKFYLNRYDPDVRASAVERTNVVTPVLIEEDSFNG